MLANDVKQQKLLQTTWRQRGAFVFFLYKVISGKQSNQRLFQISAKPFIADTFMCNMAPNVLFYFHFHEPGGTVFLYWTLLYRGHVQLLINHLLRREKDELDNLK